MMKKVKVISDELNYGLQDRFFTFPLEGMIIVDLSTNGFDLIVNLGKHLESIRKSAYTLKVRQS